ncbi:hypothetical protein HMPREF9126_1603 [Parvimonas sp. oral taxon 110 str. F0139]|nr:hypothetical protein HMPREF9126_1603 [Parvimonas sp. oral taxon 110 str. F0139]
MKIFKKKFLMFFSLLLILNLGFCNLLVAENSSDNVKKLTYIGNIFYDENGKPANWWYDDGKAWFFFKDGKKFTGIEKDASGYKYFVKGKYGSGIYKDVLYKDGVKSKGKVYAGGIFYDENAKPANWWYDDGTAWYFFQNGKKYTGIAKDGNGEMYFANGKYGNGYANKIFYGEGKPANWWYNDGTAWYFFKNGKKHTGIEKDANGYRYFVNGKYANGLVNTVLYKDGVKSKGKVYAGGVFYDENAKPANWWYDDGTAWYFFQNGKKHTGLAKDANGEMYFVNGKYGKGYADKIFYGEGKPANWWYDDGTAWYFFQNGKKHTGLAKDANGYRYFVNGKYAEGFIDNVLYKDGLKSSGKVYVNGIFYDENTKPANWWYDDGKAWYFFKDGKKFSGFGKDGNGERYFINGKYANGIYNDKLYKDGIESEGKVYVNGLFYGKDKKLANWWYDDGTAWYFFQNGKKHTGLAKDANGERYFANGKYANGYYEGTYYNEGEKFNLPETVRLTNGIRAFKFSDDKFYTGCWLYSAASGLYSKGKYITPTDLLNLLPKTGDPRTGVMGNPKEHYYRDVFPASYPSGMVPTLQKLVPSIEDYSGASFEDIKLQLAKGRTVQVWFTREMLYKKVDVGGELILASSDYHSILLIGYDNTGFYHIESVRPNHIYHMKYDELKRGYNWFDKKAILYK